jgi:hypothetical protein
MSDKNVMTQWVLYDHPRDVPDCYVARQVRIRSGGSLEVTRTALMSDNLKFISDTLFTLYPNLIYMPRMDEDDPVIMGVYL